MKNTFLIKRIFSRYFYRKKRIDLENTETQKERITLQNLDPEEALNNISCKNTKLKSLLSDYFSNEKITVAEE